MIKQFSFGKYNNGTVYHGKYRDIFALEGTSLKGLLKSYKAAKKIWKSFGIKEEYPDEDYDTGRIFITNGICIDICFAYEYEKQRNLHFEILNDDGHYYYSARYMDEVRSCIEEFNTIIAA